MTGGYRDRCIATVCIGVDGGGGEYSGGVNDYR